MGLTILKASSKGKEPDTDETPTENDIANASPTHLSVVIDGKNVEIEEQIQVRESVHRLQVFLTDHTADVCH